MARVDVIIHNALEAAVHPQSRPAVLEAAASVGVPSIAAGVAAPGITVLGAPLTIARPTILLPAGNAFPTPATTGLPAGWTPTATTNGTLSITANGTTIEDRQINGDVEIRASNVTLRRCRITGFVWNQFSSTQYGPFTLEDCDVGPSSGTLAWPHGLIGVSNYTVIRTHVHNGLDGFRVSGDDVLIQDSLYIGGNLTGEHADGLQCFGGGTNVVLDHCTIDIRNSDTQNAAAFAADSSYELTVTDCLLMGGAYTIRFHQWEVESTFVATGNRIVQGAWTYGPAYATRQPSDGSLIHLTWSDNRLVTIDSNYNVTSTGALVSAP